MTNQRSAAVRKGQLLVVLQFLILGAMVLFRGSVHAVPSRAYALGLLLFLGGIALMVVAFRSLGTSLTANPVPLESAQLVTSGMYSRLRHPIYLGLLLLTAGMALYSWSVTRFALWLALVGLLTYKIRFEEQQLVAKYPAYAQYMREVPALIPRRKR